MLEKRRYTRFDVSKDNISIYMYDPTGFSYVGEVMDISKGGLQFKTRSSIRWKDNAPVTLYFKFRDEIDLKPINVVPIRSNKKLFHSLHSGEFVGGLVLKEVIQPLLDLKAEESLAVLA